MSDRANASQFQDGSTKTESISAGGSASRITQWWRKKKRNWERTGERGERICEKNSYANPTAYEEGVGGTAVSEE